MKNILLLVAVLILLSSTCLSEWEKMDGLGTPSIGTVMVNGEDVFIIGASNGFYHSDNRGADFDYKRDFRVITLFRIQNDELYVGSLLDGLFKSTDNGDTWENIHNGLEEIEVRDLMFANNKMYLLTINALYSSLDEGENWNKIETPEIFDKFAIKGDTIYGGFKGASNDPDPGGFYVSTDGGLSWEERISGLANKKVTYVFLHNGLLYAGTYGGIYRSSNSGELWELIDSEIAINQPYKEVRILSVNDGLYIILPDKIYYSSDNGDNWETIFENIPAELYNDLAFTDYGIYAGTRSGLYFSDDNGESWSSKSSSLPSNAIYDLDSTDSYIYAASYENGLYKLGAGEEAWSALNPDITSGSYTQIVTMNENSFFLRKYGIQTLLYTTNGGDDFIEVDIDDEVNKYYGMYFDENNNFWVGTNDGLYLSSDMGSSWKEIDTTHSSLEYIVPRFSAFVEHKGKIFGLSQKCLYYSENKDTNWVEMDTTFFLERRATYLASNKHEMYMTVDAEGIYRSTDGGNTWMLFGEEFAGNRFSQIFTYGSNVFTVVSYEENGIYNRSSLFFSNNNAETWTKISEVLPNKLINDIIIKDDYLYAATSFGIYRSPLADYSINSVTEIGNYLYFYEPYPNPARNEAKALIYWDMSRDINEGEITISNVYGKEINSTGNIRIEKRNAYSGHLIWNCSDVPSGIYLIKLTHGTTSQTLKVVVSK